MSDGLLAKPWVRWALAANVVLVVVVLWWAWQRRDPPRAAPEPTGLAQQTAPASTPLPPGADTPAGKALITGDAAARTGDWAGAAKAYAEAFAWQEKEVGKDDPALAATLAKLASAQASAGANAEADAAFARSIAILEKAYGAEDPRLATGLASFAMHHQRFGRRAEAKALLERALAIDEKAFGPKHPNVAARLAALGLLLRDEGKGEEAVKLLERALVIEETPGALSRLAQMHSELGNVAKARPLFEKALAAQEAANGKRHPTVAMTLADLAALDAGDGKLDAAAPRLERAFAMEKELAWSETSQVAARVALVAHNANVAGDKERAEKVAKWAFELAKKAVGRDSAAASLLHERYVALLRSAGKNDEADALSAN